MNPPFRCLDTFERNMRGRDFAVGDIHGHFPELQVALDAIGFDETQDRLFATGDLVDRGPQSRQALQWLRKPWFYSVCGNHDVTACDAIAGAVSAVQFHQSMGGEWLAALKPPEQRRIARALGALPLAIEVETANGHVGLIHADCPSDDWQDVREGNLSANLMRRALWVAGRYRLGYEGRVRNIRAVVHGHTCIPHMTVLGNAYFIDTHGYYNNKGHFTFLQLDTLRACRGPGGEIRSYR